MTKKQVVMGSKLAGLADVGDHFQSIYIPVPNKIINGQRNTVSSSEVK